MTVTSVILSVRKGFPYDGPRRVRAPQSPHRHGGRHAKKVLGKRLTRQHEDDDARDGELLVNSEQGCEVSKGGGP